MITWHEVLLRLLAALLFCGAVGTQRYFAGKAAGVRTHILVGLGAALFTLVSGYAFGGAGGNADRIAAQVVTGIGFIGGGAILKSGAAIRGLTTAAGLWAVASLGMAAGAGLYEIGALGTAVILLTLVVLRRLEQYVPRHTSITWTIEIDVQDVLSLPRVRAALAETGHPLALQRLASGPATVACFLLEAPSAFDMQALSQRILAAGAERVVCHWEESGNVEQGI